MNETEQTNNEHSTEEEVLVKTSTNLNLFEPPPTSSSNNKKFKKGTLKLSQDDKGNWKLEENLVTLENNPMAENNNKTNNLLRRPSIKKIKAFFQQQKDELVHEAVSKIPTLGESKSVPSSLDRKKNSNAADEKEILTSSAILQNFGSLDLHKKKSQKSISSERLLQTSSDFCKPLLPIKRSKSMKMDNTESSNAAVIIPPPKPKRSYQEMPAQYHSRQNSNELNHMMASFDLAEKEASKFDHEGHQYVHEEQMVAALAPAQKKLSEASASKPRERRNSFREAVEKSDQRSYEPIWFEQGGEHQLESEQSPIYVNVLNKRASPVRKMSSELTSVSLVSEVMTHLNKQNSNSSLTSSLSGQSFNNGTKSAQQESRQPPPPYVQPPQPVTLRSQQRHQLQDHNSPYAGPQVPTSNMATYANVQFRVKGNG